MESEKHITSLQNKLVKEVLALKAKPRERRKTGLFVIEGLRELEFAFKAGYKIEVILYCPEIAKATDILLPKAPQNQSRFVELSKKVYEKLAYRGSTEGVLAIAKTKSHELPTVKLSENPLVLVAEATEKPGNLGALLRTADAANLDAVLIANPKSDVYNPNIIRSSVGCVFTTQIAQGTTEEIVSYLKENNIEIYCAALTASKNYVDVDFKRPSAIVVGTEATGLSDTWLQNSDQNIIIPMQGEIDSMNVSVSAAILIFEAKRQRGF